MVLTPVEKTICALLPFALETEVACRTWETALEANPTRWPTPSRLLRTFIDSPSARDEAAVLLLRNLFLSSVVVTGNVAWRVYKNESSSTMQLVKCAFTILSSYAAFKSAQALISTINQLSEQH